MSPRSTYYRFAKGEGADKSQPLRSIPDVRKQGSTLMTRADDNGLLRRVRGSKKPKGTIMGAKAKTQFIRRLNRWRLRKSPWKVAFLLFLWLVTIASEARASGDLKKSATGSITNTGSIRVKNQAIGLPSVNGGVYEFFGSSQSIPPMTYQDLKYSGTGTKSFNAGSPQVNGTFTIASGTTGYADPATAPMVLAGTLVEQGYFSGSIQKTVDLTSLSSSNFGDIGLTLSYTGTSPGNTTIRRVSGTALPGGPGFASNSSIKRYFDISSSGGGYNGTMVFSYSRANEIGTYDESTLELWRSTDNGANWRRQGGTVNTGAQTITKTGILSFSRWTASDATHPLGPAALEWVAQNLAATSGSSQSGSPNSNLSSPFVVTVTDGYGNVIANTPVTFAIASAPGGASGQSLTVTSANTDASGHASTVLHLGSAAGTYSVTANSAGLSGSPASFTATATGVVAPPVATSMILATGNTQVDTFGRQLANSMVVTILNQFGAPFSGATVNFAISAKPLGDTSATLSVASITTNASGQASTKLTLGTKPGTYSVVATSTALSGASISFNSTAVTGSAFALGAQIGSGQSQVVKTTLTQPFVVTVVDVFGNPIQGASVRFVLATTPLGASGQAITDTLMLTNAQGRAQTTLTLGDSVGVYEVHGISGALQGSPWVFTATATSGVLPPAAQSIVLKTGNGQSATVGSQLANPFVVTVFDQFGNPFAGTTVNFAIGSKPSGDTTASLTVLTAVTNASGQASTTLKLGTKAGSYGITATSGSLSGSPQTFSATAVAGAPAFANLPLGTVMSGEVATPLGQTFFVAVTDSFGNPINGLNVRFANVGIPAGATGQYPIDTTVVTDAQGQSFVRYTPGTKAGVYTIAVTAGTLPPRFMTINATAGPAKSLALVSGNNQTNVAGSTLGLPMVVTVSDAYGNSVGGAPVSFAITSTPFNASGQSLNATNVATGTSGQALTVLTLGNKPGQYVVSATSGSLTGSPAFFVANATPAGAPSMVQFTGANQAGTIKTALGQPFVVRAVDASGAPLSGISVTFAIDSIPNAASGQSLSSTIVLTDNIGFASSTLTLGDKGGVYRVSATSAGLGGSPIFFRATATASGIPVALVSAAGDRGSAPVGTQLVNPFVVTVLDGDGNPVAGQPVRFSLAGVPAGATGTALTDTVVFTNAQGQAISSLTMGTKVGTYTVTASSGSLNAITFTASGVAGRGVYLLLAAGNNQVGEVMSTLPQRFVVSVTDTFGNAKQGVNVLFGITSAPSNAARQALSSAQTVTDSTGHASVLLTLGTKVGTYQVAATSAGLTGTPVISATAIAGKPIFMLLASGNNQAGQVGTPLAQPFAVSVTDSFGNVKPGVTVQFTLTSAPANANGQSLTSIQSVTDSAGIASAVLVLGDRAGSYQVSAASAGLSGSPVRFTGTATTSVATRMAYTAGDKQAAEVFTQLASPLTVTVTDAAGNPVSGQPVRFVVAGAPAGSTGSSLSDTLVFTNAQGQATARMTLGTKAGDYVVTALSGSLNGSPVSFTATAVAGRPTYLVLTDGNNQTGLAANTLSEPLAVAVTDTFGNVKPGVTVNYALTSFPDSATGQMLTSTSAVTNSDGEASVRLTLGSRIGLYTVSATSGTLLGSPATFRVSASKVAGSNQQGIVSNRLQQPFSTLVLDASGRPLAGVFVTFTIDSIPSGASGASFNGSTSITVMTDSTGKASAFLTLGNAVGTYRVTASSPALPSGSVIFRATAVSSSNLATMIYKSGDNQSGQILTQLVTPLEVTVLDANGNPQAGQKVTFGVVSGPAGAVGQLLTPETVVTDASGRAATSVKLGSKVGVYRIAATSSGLEGSPVDFNVRATVGAALALVYVTGDSQMKQIGATLDSAFVVRVVDVGENPVPGIQVQFALDSIPNGATGQRLNVLNSVTDAQGRAAAVLTFGDRAGVYKVTAALSGHVPIVFRATAITSTGAVNLVYTSGDAQSAQILAQLTSPIVVRVLNASGNPVPGQTVTFAVDSLPSGATGQLITPSVATTDASGRATAVVKLGDKVGAYRISASAAGLSGSPVQFRLQAVAGAARSMFAVAGDGQSKPIGVVLDSALVVGVVDQGGNPVAGVAVQFTLDAGPVGANGQRLTVLNSVTDAKGQASTVLTLGTKVGAYGVMASTSALPGTVVRFTANASSGAAAALVLTSGSEQSAFIFAELTAPFVVTAVDIGGNPVAGVNVQFALDSIPRSAVGQSLRVFNSTTDANGQASAMLRLGNKEGRYTVLATAPNLIVSTVRFAATATVLTGDVNGNTMVDVADLTTVIDHVLGKIILTGIDSIKADFNRNGRIDVVDIVAMQNYLLTISLVNTSIVTLDTDPLLPMNVALAAGDSSNDVKGELVLNENGVRFNLTNAIPVKGVQLIVRFRPGVNIARPDVVFDRARVDSFYTNISGNEMRIVAYNLQNIAIPAGDGPLFRLPINLSDVGAIESAQMIVSKTDVASIYDQALARTVSVRKAVAGEIPTSFILFQNYPNPFNDRTNISYEVGDAAGRVDVKVQVFNALGEKVKTLASGVHAGGRFTVVWDGMDDAGRKLASGAYYYRLISGTFMSAKKMIMLK
ncbi:MAG: Ig-like domain-containing protein [Ignavibacteriales bacterium]|nr:Ig-like domain-containing protein [Ignavibacteriales bacterium]